MAKSTWPDEQKAKQWHGSQSSLAHSLLWASACACQRQVEAGSCADLRSPTAAWSGVPDVLPCCVLIFFLPPQPVLGSQMYWLVWVALAGVGIGAGMTFVPSLPALLHATRTLVRISRPL